LKEKRREEKRRGEGRGEEKRREEEIYWRNGKRRYIVKMGREVK
jgi:hypothetical protein